jgi:hypothetical protein
LATLREAAVVVFTGTMLSPDSGFNFAKLSVPCGKNIASIVFGIASVVACGYDVTSHMGDGSR